MEHWDLNEQHGLFSSLVFLLFFSRGGGEGVMSKGLRRWGTAFFQQTRIKPVTVSVSCGTGMGR